MTGIEVLLSDPKVQAMLAGLAVKLVVDLLKKRLVSLDADGNKKYAVPVQVMVGVCSLAVTVGNLYLTGGLHTIDPQQITSVLLTVLPVYLNAMGIHILHGDLSALGKKDVS